MHYYKLKVHFRLCTIFYKSIYLITRSLITLILSKFLAYNIQRKATNIIMIAPFMDPLHFRGPGTLTESRSNFKGQIIYCLKTKTCYDSSHMDKGEQKPTHFTTKRYIILSTEYKHICASQPSGAIDWSIGQVSYLV